MSLCGIFLFADHHVYIFLIKLFESMNTVIKTIFPSLTIIFG